MSAKSVENQRKEKCPVVEKKINRYAAGGQPGSGKLQRKVPNHEVSKLTNTFKSLINVLRGCKLK
jgi:hypothetical protein